MFRITRTIALAILIAACAAPLRAEPALGPPDWPDGASVYLALGQKRSSAEKPTTKEPTTPPIHAEDAKTKAAGPVNTTDALPIDEAAAMPAASDAPAASPESIKPKSDSRYLPPPTAPLAPAGPNGADEPSKPASAAARRLADFGVPMQSIYTILSALAIVIGAFLLFAWMLRRGSRAMGGRRGQLPADVVSVLGRVPLAARQFAELLRVGNKLVLVSLTPTGAETLTEVTDPAEVDRLVGLCQQNNPFSTTKAFEQVFQQLSSESAPSGFLGNESPPTSFASPAGAYRANRGGTTRGK